MSQGTSGSDPEKMLNNEIINPDKTQSDEPEGTKDVLMQSAEETGKTKSIESEKMNDDANAENTLNESETEVLF